MANLKISQLEKLNNLDSDAYVLVVQNGKNYKMSVKEAIAANIDIDNIELPNYYTKDETNTVINETIENTIQNINKDVATESDAEETFNNIFTI